MPRTAANTISANASRWCRNARLAVTRRSIVGLRAMAMTAHGLGHGLGQGLRVEVVKAVRAPLAPAYLRAVLRAAALEPAVADAAAPAGPEPVLTLRVTGDRELRRLNREFLGEDHA